MFNVKFYKQTTLLGANIESEAKYETFDFVLVTWNLGIRKAFLKTVKTQCGNAELLPNIPFYQGARVCV